MASRKAPIRTALNNSHPVGTATKKPFDKSSFGAIIATKRLASGSAAGLKGNECIRANVYSLNMVPKLQFQICSVGSSSSYDEKCRGGRAITFDGEDALWAFPKIQALLAGKKDGTFTTANRSMTVEYFRTKDMFVFTRRYIDREDLADKQFTLSSAAASVPVSVVPYWTTAVDRLQAEVDAALNEDPKKVMLAGGKDEEGGEEENEGANDTESHERGDSNEPRIRGDGNEQRGRSNNNLRAHFEENDNGSDTDLGKVSIAEVRSTPPRRVVRRNPVIRD